MKMFGKKLVELGIELILSFSAMQMEVHFIVETLLIPLFMIEMSPKSRIIRLMKNILLH